MSLDKDVLSVLDGERMIKGYKTVTNDLKSGHGDCQWVVEEWKKHKGELKTCISGFHACKHPFDVLNYLQGDRLFLVEAKGKFLEQGDKFVAEEMRLVKEIKDFKFLCVEFSIGCAKSVLINFEKVYPKDKRPRLAIEASLEWLQLKTSAAMSAAMSAAESARSSAMSAAMSAAESARSSARSAAESAAWSARSVARSAEMSARLAAWSAVWSADSAAMSARLAAESAAESARSSARSAQKKTFLKLTLKYQKRS